MKFNATMHRQGRKITLLLDNSTEGSAMADAIRREFMQPETRTVRATRHHLEQFGNVPIERLGMKLGEESGEVQGAMIRDCERRNGRPWIDEIKNEIRDVLTVLHVICGRNGWDFDDFVDSSVERFMARRWNTVRKDHEIAKGKT